MNNLNINSAKTAGEIHKFEQAQLREKQENKERVILHDMRNEEYSRETIKIAKDCRTLSIISLVVAIVAMIISIFK